VELSPRAAVLESFSRLEATLREAVPTQDRRPTSIRRLGSLAVEARILTEQEAGILNDLTTLRNVAAHESLDMDADQARVFVDLAARLVRSIEATPPSWPQ
jgi:uncharacterized protein YutE (UPF0331/DUF86 family)